MTGLLVFGRTGQVATELARLAPDARFLDRASADLADPETCARAIRDSGCDAVINAAAYTAVDRAESEPDLARAVNGDAPAAMARAAAAAGIPLVHISTDYVFDGSGTAPWRETDATGPLGVYGATKLAGEQGIAAAGGQWAVLRTSWVFSAHGANFVKTMLRLGSEREELRVVADQHGGPTPAAEIAAACLTMARVMRDDRGRGGIYHFSGAPDTSWAGFAGEIMAQAGLSCRVTDIATSQYPTPARRPANSRLDCAALQRDFGLARPDWRAGLAKVLQELKT
ncbi:dTDP-4-dehydrorhamnose reductase [Paracoccus halophilus]|uniref:dTDP-4-dehydrorhamnose reductase n=1 Tax=Paracoccus halophilus TaxID=376733 RepID=A0A099F807_9RHOB|nr:dTDP-4-dehydrorhamnose reductase [Paracoccus halophilus]KGJ06619.1 dTDP-4-dehydrorhamnose reductase [Paracoccus halophilus]SFA42662.1 dTDP-4-dehydrorhamnose reductase [Paracoccus halophilus]